MNYTDAINNLSKHGKDIMREGWRGSIRLRLSETETVMNGVGEPVPTIVMLATPGDGSEIRVAWSPPEIEYDCRMNDWVEAPELQKISEPEVGKDAINDA